MPTPVVEEVHVPACPLCIGNPLRVSTTAWENWGIRFSTQDEFVALVRQSENCYSAEWKDTDDTRLHDIARSAEDAGLGDCNARLNTAVAEEVFEVSSCLPEELRVLDIGAGTGNTSKEVLKALRASGRRVFLHMLEPDRKALVDTALRKITNSDMISPDDIRVHLSTDLCMTTLFPSCSFDLVVSSAALHHHAFLDPVMAAIHNILKPQGFLVVGDWHNSMWLDPGRVLSLLKTLDGCDNSFNLDVLWRFVSAHPAHERDPFLQQANEQICAFWRAYSKRKTTGAKTLEMLEGHRPPDEYSRLMRKAGLTTLRPVRCLLDSSSLLCIHAARKIEA